LKETEQIKSDFFTSVSHELRTPLSLILAPVESVISGKYGILSDEQLHALKTVQNNSIRLLQIVNGLLDFSKFEAGKMTIERESTDLNYMTQAILKDFESLFRTKKIELTYETNLARRYALIDRYLFERILFNLLSNAVKFTPEYGKVHVTISAEEDNIKLTVTDTGKGITESEMQSLFTKFRQAESSSSRRFEGSGLGLAMVKEFAELLDGGVQVSSKPGEGSIFTVILRAPATDLVPAETEFRLKRPVLLPQQHHFAGQYESRFVKSDVQLKMLVCEDNEELQSYIVSLVNELCQVRTAKDGEEAARIIKSWKPDLVLSDIMMPKKDGIELCKEIKRNPETSHIAVILLTALTHREALLKGWEARADEYLFKPFHPEELITRVKSMLLSIKDRYEATGKIEEKNRELQVINSEMENFTYSVSHDLRAPLRAIDGYARIIEEDYTSVLDTEGRRLLNEVRRNAQKMGGLIDNLLTLSRVGRKEINRTVLDMNEMVQQVIVEVERTTHHKAKITLANLYPVAADRNLIIQMLQNLVSNAIKYTSKVAQPVIEITSTKEKNQIIYKISDNGAGFDMKYINKLFGVFQRLHTTEDFEGTGVGLAIVQRIIHKHGGRVWAEGEVGNGACFYFSLPALPEGMPKEAIIENDPKN
jgi:signal transduction histidine kinase